MHVLKMKIIKQKIPCAIVNFYKKGKCKNVKCFKKFNVNAKIKNFSENFPKVYNINTPKTIYSSNYKYDHIYSSLKTQLTIYTQRQHLIKKFIPSSTTLTKLILMAWFDIIIWRLIWYFYTSFDKHSYGVFWKNLGLI